MNTMNRAARCVAVLITSALLLGCTPEQLAMYQAVTGDRLDPEREATMLALPDHPMRLADGSTIQIDGEWTQPEPCYMEEGRVNALVYTYTDPVPAMDAFRTVARCRGWSQAQIDSWAVAVEDIMRFESGFCYNVLGGARMEAGPGCNISRQGTKGDAGFGQLIGIHYRTTTPGTGWLCAQEGLCSKQEVVATPWASMTSLLALIERSGTSGWCYNSFARSLHKRTCRNAGLDV